MNAKKFTWEFDPNGTSPENKIIDEAHTISPANGKDFRFIVPRAAPFHVRSVVLRHRATGKELVRGVDWFPGHEYAAQNNTAPFPYVAGSILISSDVSGTLILDEYQTLGGEHTVDLKTIEELLANTLIDPRTTTWDKVVGAPAVYDSLAHLHHVINSYGYQELVEAFDHFVDTYTLEASNLKMVFENHRQDKNNPHDITADQLGLEHLVEVRAATFDQVLIGENTVNYVTPDTLKRIRTQSSATTSRMVYVQSDGKAYLGHTAQLTYRSGVNNLTNGAYAVDATHHGFKNNAGDWIGYFDTSNVFHHSGMVRLSDSRYKNDVCVMSQPEASDAALRLVEWTWSQDTTVPKHLRGTYDTGVLAQRVKQVYPTCVHRDEEGTLSVDYGKLAVHLILNPPKRKSFLGRLGQWLANTFR